VVAELTDVSADMPWFEARFQADEAFSEIEPLFLEERELAEADHFDADKWQATWERIWATGVALQLADGKRQERGFAVHVYSDGPARFRY
jgi:hypothetical protein